MSLRAPLTLNDATGNSKPMEKVIQNSPPISGFTVVRNAVLMDYPIVESIKSLLPIVDEYIVAVGQSDDQTRDLIAAIGSDKIKIIDTFWDTKKTSGGLILSEKTNEALQHCSHDWCFYLQADEVIHEEDWESIRQSLVMHSNDPRVEGLLFKYIHFYGSHHVIATARNWYRQEIRLVRKSTGIQSHGDAQGFRVDGRKAFVKPTRARVFHYGWAKPPEQMGQKNKLLSRWWHGNKLDNAFDQFQYSNDYGLKKFTGTHPKVMRERVAAQTWNFDPKKHWSDWNLKELNYLASDIFEFIFRFRIGEYKNYRLLKD